jgi:hypothetical protein
MSVLSSLCRWQPPWLGALVLFGILSPAARAAADGRARPTLAVHAGYVALAEGEGARIFDPTGREIARLAPPKPDADQPPAGDAAVARARAFDRLGVPEADRDTDAALDLVEGELSLTEKRAERATAPAPPDLTHAVALSDARGFLIFAGGLIWRYAPGGRPQKLGRAPAGVVAAALSPRGLLIVARPTDVLVSHDDGAHFAVIDRPAVAPVEVVVDGTGRFYATRSPGRIDLVSFHGAELRRLVFRPRVNVNALAACAGALAIAAANGLHLVSATGEARRVWAAPAHGLACGNDPTAPWVLFGDEPPEVSRNGGQTFAREPRLPAGITAAATEGADIWVYAPAEGLRHLGAGAAFASPVRELPAAAAASAPTARAAWRDVLPYLGLFGWQAERPGRRDYVLGLLAEWRLGPAPTRAAGDLVQPAAFSPAVDANDPGGGPPEAVGGELGPSAPALPTPDPDARCLPYARTRAIARFLVDPERARSLVARAGRSAWLPELRLRAEKRAGRSESVDYKPTAANDALGLDTTSTVLYEVRATWDLPRLVFNPEEIGASAQALRIADMRREIEAQVNRLYFERRRLLRTSPASGDGVTLQIRLEEIDAELDALSGGEFARCLRQTLRGAP